MKRSFRQSPICRGLPTFWCTYACKPTKTTGAHSTCTITRTHNPHNQHAQLVHIPPIMASLSLLSSLLLLLLPLPPTFWHSGSGGSGGGGGRGKAEAMVQLFATKHILNKSSLLLSLMHHCWHQHLCYCCHHCRFCCHCCFRCCRYHHGVFTATFS